jgi:hypothetical protein
MVTLEMVQFAFGVPIVTAPLGGILGGVIQEVMQ